MGTFEFISSAQQLALSKTPTLYGIIYGAILASVLKSIFLPKAKGGMIVMATGVVQAPAQL